MGFFDKLFGNKGKGGGVKFSPVDYNQYFSLPALGDTPLALFSLGDLHLSTGKIVACDPLVFLGDSLPFTRTVKPGKYPVVVAIAKTGTSGDRYAAVKVEFSKDQAVKWELAVNAEQDVSKLQEEDSYYGYAVDAGLGCFCDLEAQTSYRLFESDFLQKNPDANMYDDFFAEEFKKNADQHNPAADGDWVNFYLPNNPSLNIMMFHSGYGDGTYPCYWGLNDKGEVCSLVVDFIVL